MNFENFFSSIADKNISLPVVVDDSSRHQLNNEALFQLPLICLIVLLMAKDKRRPRVSEVGQ